MKPLKVKLVNMVGVDTREFDRYFLDHLDNGTPLPEEISDVFKVDVIAVDGERRGVIRWA